MKSVDINEVKWACDSRQYVLATAAMGYDLFSLRGHILKEPTIDIARPWIDVMDVRIGGLLGGSPEVSTLTDPRKIQSPKNLIFGVFFM